MIRLRNRVNGGIVSVDEDFAAQLDPTQWGPADKETPSKPARKTRKKAEDDSGNAGD